METDGGMSDHGTQDDTTQDDPIALARAFAAARDCVEFGETALELGVGERAAEVEARFPASMYAFVTAWNPAAESQPVRDNAEADDALAAHIAALGAECRRTWAQAPDGAYREAGWLIGGLDADRADALGREFGQAGVLAWLAGEPVRLHMLMPQPPGADLPDVDGIE